MFQLQYRYGDKYISDNEVLNLQRGMDLTILASRSIDDKKVYFYNLE